MEQYHALCEHILEHGTKRKTGREREHSACLVTKCASPFKMVFLSLRRKSYI